MKSLILAGVIMFIGATTLLVANYEKLDIQRLGRLVKMEIVKMPSSCVGTKNRYFVTYKYEGELFEKATTGNYCSKHSIGEFVEMRFLAGKKYILRPDESVTQNLLSFGALGLMGLLMAYSQYRRLRKPNVIFNKVNQ